MIGQPPFWVRLLDLLSPLQHFETVSRKVLSHRRSRQPALTSLLIPILVLPSSFRTMTIEPARSSPNSRWVTRGISSWQYGLDNIAFLTPRRSTTARSKAKTASREKLFGEREILKPLSVMRPLLDSTMALRRLCI